VGENHRSKPELWACLEASWPIRSAAPQRLSLWQRYNLFPKREKSFDTISGAASYDISMLMTYVAAEKYLAVGGKLGFVLSQSIFKTSAAGQGFRRFRLPDGTALGPLVVENLTELEPFEGASNRTTVDTFRRATGPHSPSHTMSGETARGAAEAA
jgi:hypothetical protein